MTSPQYYRRQLHEIPELGFELPQTTALVKRVLSALPCTVTEPVSGAVAAFFDMGQKETFAFRADMDALPIAEKTGAAYASRHAGQMHACGHDGHTAALLSFAEYLAEQKRPFSRNVLLIFEPAEETVGGAKKICDTGLLEKCNTKAVFGIHLWPGLAAGQIASCAGGMMASTCETTLTFLGKSSHIAKASEGADALAAASRFLCEAYAGLEQMENPNRRLLKFGCMQAGTVRNALAAKAQLAGSLRAVSAAERDELQAWVRELAAGAAAQEGCTVQTDFGRGYPPVENDPDLVERVVDKLCATHPIKTAQPAMTGEDFSFYGQRAPSVFFFFGVGDTAPLHADTFDFDDSLLASIPGFYAQLLDL